MSPGQETERIPIEKESNKALYEISYNISTEEYRKNKVTSLKF